MMAFLILFKEILIVIIYICLFGAVQAGNVAVFLADDLPRVRGALSDVMARGKRPQGIGIACDGPHRWVNSEII